MKTIAALGAALSCFSASGAMAHDFWLAFDRWRTDGDSATVSAAFLVGHAGESENWALKPQRVVHFLEVGPGGLIDIESAIVPPKGKAGARADIAIEGAGTHLIVFESDNDAYSDLPADKFNAYLEEEGITPPAARRRELGVEDESGRERYSRRAKALVQIGAAATNDALAPVGHTLEIVPLDNPFALAGDQPMRVAVRWRGEPLAGALVHFESLELAILPESKRRTDENGVAAFVFPRSGAWKVNVAWSEPLKGDPKADFETVFASLTFGY